MYKVTNTSMKLPNILKIRFPDYETARSAIRKYLRTIGYRGNPATSALGFNIVRT